MLKLTYGDKSFQNRCENDADFRLIQCCAACDVGNGRETYRQAAQRWITVETIYSTWWLLGFSNEKTEVDCVSIEWVSHSVIDLRMVSTCGDRNTIRVRRAMYSSIFAFVARRAAIVDSIGWTHPMMMNV
jgi:hypothetical protein